MDFKSGDRILVRCEDELYVSIYTAIVKSRSEDGYNVVLESFGLKNGHNLTVSKNNAYSIATPFSALLTKLDVFKQRTVELRYAALESLRSKGGYLHKLRLYSCKSLKCFDINASVKAVHLRNNGLETFKSSAHIGFLTVDEFSVKSFKNCPFVNTVLIRDSCLKWLYLVGRCRSLEVAQEANPFDDEGVEEPITSLFRQKLSWVKQGYKANATL